MTETRFRPGGRIVPGRPATLRTVALSCLAILSVASAVIHFATAGQHFQQYWLVGVFMLGAGWLQLLWAAAAAARRGQRRPPRPSSWWPVWMWERPPVGSARPPPPADPSTWIAASSNNVVKGLYAFALSPRQTGLQRLSLLFGLAVLGLVPLFF